MPLDMEKLERIHSLLDKLSLQAVAFTTQANFAWATGGADNHVGLATEAGAAALVVARDRAAILTNNIEQPRIAAEEAAGLDIEVLAQQWWEEDLSAAITAWAGSEDWAADIPLAGRPSVEPHMYDLRVKLTEAEIDSYRRLGRMAGLAMTEAVARLERGMTESEAAGVLAQELISRSLTPHVLLVAADERLANYRHPIPREKRIERICMLSTGARWKGLICSITRIVHFGTPPEELMERHRAVCMVDAAFITHTIPGETIGDAVQMGLRAYAEQGYGDEWMRLHQGGPTGYKPREFRGLPDSPQTIEPFQPFAWNPTITGTKSEDTILAAEPLPEVLTHTPDWPAVKVEIPGGVLERPDILIK